MAQNNPSRFSKTVPKSAQETQMRDSDKRKFRLTLASTYPDLGKDQLESLVPKNASIVIAKLQPKDELISRGSDPIFFTDKLSPLAKKVEYIPTCYALHCAPQALCRVVLVHPGIEKQISRGADLFLPGVVKPDEDWPPIHTPWPNVLFGGRVSKGQLCCIASASQPWSPYAVGRFHRSTEDFTITGLQGIAVDIIHFQGDALWDLGSKILPSTSPPHSLIAALAEKQQVIEEAARAHAEREKVEAEKVRCARIEEIPKCIRKLEKTMRQIKELQVKSAAGAKLDLAQLEKLNKEVSVFQAIESLKKEMTELLSPMREVTEDGEGQSCQSPEVGEEEEEANGQIVDKLDDQNALEAQVEEENHKTEKEGEDVQIEGDGQMVEKEGEGDDHDEDEGEDGHHAEELATYNEPIGMIHDVASPTDELFFCSLLTELSLLAPSRANPVLISTLFGKASMRAGGIGVKQTSWKSSTQFLANALPKGAVTFREAIVGAKVPSKGKQKQNTATELVGFDANIAPCFTSIKMPQTGGGGGGASNHNRMAIATKNGSREVSVTARRVRNNNITLIDGLEDWGFDKKTLETLASELRRIFSVSASVVERSGTGDNQAHGRRQLWSVQLGGKFVDQIAIELRRRGVTKVSASAKKGMLNKLDKQQFKHLS